jgi:hypothetical protein
MWLLFGYILSTYLFYLPWLPFWRESFQEDNGIVVMMATVVVFLSPILLPLMIAMMGAMFYLQMYENSQLLALGLLFVPLLYYGIILTASIYLIRWIAERFRRWLNKQSLMRLQQ